MTKTNCAHKSVKALAGRDDDAERERSAMSENCKQCHTNSPAGADLLCDYCRQHPSELAASAGSVEWPAIGKDPLKYRDEVKGGVEGAMERLGQACAVQQKGVPDQTALVWRIDLDRIRCELIVMTARWNSRKKNEAPPNTRRSNSDDAPKSS